MEEMVLQTLIGDGKEKSRAVELIACLEGVDSDAVKREEGRITLIGEVDPEYVLSELGKSGYIAQLRAEQIGSRSLSEHGITIRQNSSRSRSRDLGIGPSKANDLYIQYIQRFVDLAPAFHWGVLVFTLGSCALWLSNPVFWLCWSVLITEAVIFYAIQPYCNWIEDSTQTTDQSVYTRKPHRLSDHGRAGAIFLKVGISFALITLLLYSQGITQRQTKILLFVALSIILFEGFMPFLIVREELRSLMKNSSGKGEQMICNITEDHKWKASNFLFPSVINAMISVTGSIVLGGDLGSLMRQNPYWVVVSIFVVDLLAEAIHRFDCGKRSLFDIPEFLPKMHCVAIILRLVIEGCLCYWMTNEICQDSYFPSHVNINACNGQCQERSKQLLITMVALGGLQAAGTLIPPLCSCVLVRRYFPNILLSAIVLPYKLICSLVYVINILYVALGRLRPQQRRVRLYLDSDPRRFNWVGRPPWVGRCKWFLVYW